MAKKGLLHPRFVFFSFAVMLAGVAAARAETGAAFLNGDFDARTAALGAGEAVTRGAAAAFKNPAGTAEAESNELFFSYSQGFLGSSLQGFSYVHPIEREESSSYSVLPQGIVEKKSPRKKLWVLGVSGRYNTEGSITSTDENFNTTGSFRPYDASLGITAAAPFGSRAFGGMTVKAIRQYIGSESANGAALDLGLMTNLPVRGLSVSGSLLNVGPPMKFVSEKYSLPATAGVGFAYQWSVIRLVSDFRLPLAGSSGQIWGVGTELLPVRGIALRLGYANNLRASAAGLRDSNNQLLGLALGAGIQMRRYTLDYALVPETLTVSHKISLSAKF